MLQKSYFTILFCLTLVIGGRSQSFILDSTFGIAGRFTSTFEGSGGRFWCTAIQADGSILGGGFTFALGIRASMVRCLSDGTLDTSFSNDGVWIASDPDFIWITRIIVQPDGKILCAGRSLDQYKIVRLLPNGTYDTGFGINGIVSFSAWAGTNNDLTINDMKLQHDAKIIIIVHSGDRGFIVARLQTNGTLDNDYGNSGIFKYPEIPNDSFYYSYLTQVICSDNSSWVAGYRSGAIPNKNILIKLSENGTLDSSIGDNGVLLQSQGGNHLSNYSRLFILPNDSLYILGKFSENQQGLTGLIKFDANGIPDTTFAGDGVGGLPYLTYSSAPLSGYLQQDGKMLVFGGNTGVGFLGRYDAQGYPDSSFGEGGIIKPETNYEIFYDGFEQADGKVVVASRYKSPEGAYLGSLLRYKFSETSDLSELNSAISAIEVFPNPVTNETLQLAYNLIQPAELCMEWLNIDGRMIGVALKARRAAGRHTETISFPVHTPPGVYFLQIKSDQGNKTLKIIKY